MAEHKIRQTAKKNTVYKEKVKKKKKEDDEKIVSKKQQSQAKRAAAEKSGRTELKKTGNQHADERRTGAIRAQRSTAVKATKGAAEYVVQKHAQDVAKAWTATNKRAAETAGHGNRGKSGQVHAPTKSADRANKTQASLSEQYRANEKKNKAKEKAVKKSNYKGNEAVAAGRNAVKKLERANEKSLEYGASGFSDKKHKIKAPIVGEIEFSNKDIYKGSVKAGNEMLDYALPYGGTAKGAIKSADAILKAGKAAKAGKVLTEIGEKGGKQLSESGMKVVNGIAQKAAKEGKKADLEGLQKRILKSDLKENIKRELLANAMQDATVGTAVDLAKGMEEGYTGKDLAKYMGENALLNIGVGAPISAIAGKTGKAGKKALAEDIKGTFNKQFATANKFTDAQRKELVALEARESFGINTPEQTEQLQKLRDKAITNRAGVAQIDAKGKLISNDNGIVTDIMSKGDVREFARLQAKYETGSLNKGEASRLRELATTVGDAYEAVQKNATMAIDAVKRGADVNLDNMDSAVNFYRRTGEEKRVAAAVKARTETAMRQFNTDKTTAKFITSTVDRSNGDIMIRPINGDDAKQLLGLPEDKIIDGFTKTVNGKKYVFINPKSTRGTSITLAHELTHHAIDDFGKFIDTMKNYAKGDFDVKKGEIREPYEQQGLTDAEIDEEVSCDLMAEYIDKQKTEYFAHLMGEDKTVFQKMRNYFKKVIGGDPDYSKDKKFKELSKMFDDAYNGNIGAKEGEKYALRNLPPDAGKSETKLYERYLAAKNKGNTEQAINYEKTLDRYEKYRGAARLTFGKAKNLQEQLDDVVADVSKSLGFKHTSLREGKSTDSMLSKVADRQKADRVEDLNDLFRHKVEMNSFADTKNTAESIIEKLQEKGFKILDAEVKDNKKSGYKGLHITIEKNGLGGEIQLSTKEHWEFKEKSDEIYDSIRELDERDARGEKLTKEEEKELLDGYDKSIKLWNEFNADEFYKAADDFNDVRKGLQSQRGGSTASPTSEILTRSDGSTHSPSTSSSKASLSEENLTVRPSSNSTGRPSKSDNSAMSNPPKKSGNIIPEKGGNNKTKMALSANKQTIVAGKGSANEVLSLGVVKSKLHGADKNNPALLKKIRKDTGWYKDGNGNWKFDIDVSNMKLKSGINNLIKKGDMGGIINEEVDGIDAFFKNFPDVGEASIKFANLGDKPYELTTSKSGKMLYGIVLNSQLAKKNSEMFKASGLAKPNILVNDTLSDALQDIVRQMDEGKLNGQNPDYIDGDLFDIEAIRKLANQSQKPVFKDKIGSVKDLDDTITAVKSKKKPTKAEQQKSYEDFKARAEQRWAAMSDQELNKEIKSLNFTRDGRNFKEVSENYKRVMLENGSLLPTKDAVKEQLDPEDFALKWIKTKKNKSLVDIYHDVDKDPKAHEIIEYFQADYGGDRIYHAAKIAYTAEICECSYKDAAKVVEAIYDYTGSMSNPKSYGKDVENLINKYVDNAPAYLMDEGQVIYHGVGTSKKEKLDAIERIWNEHGAGAVLAADVHPNAKAKGKEGAASSWSTDKHTAHGFTGGQYVIWVRCHNCITGTSITHLSYFDTKEWEVLFGTHAQWTMINFERGTYNGKDCAYVDVIERAENAPEPTVKFALAETLGESKESMVAAPSAKAHAGEVIENYEKALKNATTDEERKAIQAEIDKLKGAKSTSNEPELTRPLDVKGIIQRTRRTKTADPEFFNETAKREIRALEEKYGGQKEFNDLVTGFGESGKLGKYIEKSREESLAIANAELGDVGYEQMLKEYYKAGFDEDPNLMKARANVLVNEIDRMNAAGEIPDDVAWSEKFNIISKNSSATGFASKVLRAQKEYLTATKEGRIIVVQKEIEKLEKQYKDRIKGGKLKIDDAKLEELANATGYRKDELLDEINRELWEQIPASLMERMNEYRHCFMLFNAKTHGRNVFGNTVFRFARAISDGMEHKVLNSKVARNKIGKLQGKDASEVIIDKQKVTRKEIQDNIAILENEFHAIYDKSGSRNKFIEMGRPDGVATVKFKPMQKLIDFNYKWLEKEDLKGALKPAFNKAYVGYCKARCPKETDLYDFMKNMSPAQKEKARHFALVEGEYATFRDSCAFSDWLIGKKQMFAGKSAKTKWGTFGYRALDAVLEGAIPFVKTPVNIFRRSVDFSPASVVFSLGKLANAKSADEFMYGVHQLCTGLTGTGMAGLGVLLASQGLITVKAGEESGDAYMDRDMGFQDYSLKIPIGDKEYSWTLDWMSPMGMSLFGGAAFQKCLAQDGWDNQSVLNMFYACTSPMTDMSFMSSPKDTMQRFLENATRGSGDKETDFGGALAQLIVGDMPKNYVSGFFPQLMAQFAGATDEYQRDTRSTQENVYLKGWESSYRQLVNKVPVLREHVLNKKINRRGEDVKTGDNIVIRMANSFFNPANVKEINENETDRELIKIRNHMERGTDDYKYFYYNLTGSPNYNLADGKRMNYKDLYQYGRSSRIKQNKMVETMIHADSYKNMTWKMRADEVDDSHWVGNAVADLKTYGANYAVKALCKDNEKEKELLKTYRQLNGKGEQTNANFMDYYIKKETLLARSHATGDDTYRIKGIVAVQSGDSNLLSALDIHKSKITDVKNYIKSVKAEGGTKAEIKDKIFKDLSDGCCNIMAEANKADITNPAKGVKSVAAGVCAARGEKIPENVYRFYGHNWNSAQAGGGLQLKYNDETDKYGVAKISEMKTYLRTLGDTDESGSVNKKEVIDYIDNTLKVTDPDEAACLYEVLYNGGRYKNPYKSQIDDHLDWRENHDDDWGTGTGGGGHGGGGRRGRRGGGGGGGRKGKMPSTDTGAIGGRVTNPFSTSNGTSASNLNDAYRKKARQLREKMN